MVRKNAHRSAPPALFFANAQMDGCENYGPSCVCVCSPDSPITFTIEVPADGSSLICVDYKLLLLGHSEGISQIPEAVCAPKT